MRILKILRDRLSAVERDGHDLALGFTLRQSQPSGLASHKTYPHYGLSSAVVTSQGHATSYHLKMTT